MSRAGKAGGKSKGVAAKAGGKSKEVAAKAGGKSKEVAAKAGGKSKEVAARAGKRPAAASGGRFRAGGPGLPEREYLTVIGLLADALWPQDKRGHGRGAAHIHEDVVLLEDFAKAHGLSPEAVRKAASRSGFFAVEEITVRHGSIIARDMKHMAVVRGTEGDIERCLKRYPGHVFAASSIRDGFLRRVRGTLEEDVAASFRGAVRFPVPVQYEPPPLTREILFAQAGKVQEPGETDVRVHGDDTLGGSTGARVRVEHPAKGRKRDRMDEMLLRRMLPAAKAHTFPDGTVARSLDIWLRWLACAPDAEVRGMLLSGELDGWLSGAGFDELAALTGSLRNRVRAAADADDNPVKPRLFGRIRDSGAGDAIFGACARPLLDTLADAGSGDADLLVEAIAVLGGRQAVEPLIAQVYNPDERLRRAVIAGLGDLGDRRATPSLVKILEFSKDEGDRLAAMEALVALGDERVGPALERVAAEDSPVGRAAGDVLEKLYGNG